ncbi:hypothetical protein E3E14_07240 [Streptomyces sp. ICN441]|uniref:hypothetical protein n=1 Tax=Streptomyces sp. ICN441 TaxID=2558286 RepID=UPI00106980D7|nr:hypothetical protein [Streptomyces sp. ICN441]TFE54535.1 hypothetical protein E3E14_07240 [Streptomyces sp. ICN441]
MSLSLECGDNLAAFRAKQEKQRRQWGDAYVESGRVWTHENGEALHPDWISRRFTLLIGWCPVEWCSSDLRIASGHEAAIAQLSE